jgi:hypothetical protein
MLAETGEKAFDQDQASKLRMRVQKTRFACIFLKWEHKRKRLTERLSGRAAGSASVFIASAAKQSRAELADFASESLRRQKPPRDDGEAWPSRIDCEAVRLRLDVNATLGCNLWLAGAIK